jgi:AhpD family alkylhydroperoxidase
MSNDFPKLAKELSNAIGILRKGTSEPMQAFSGLARSALTPGVLDTKTKELIAIAVSIAVRCDGCVAFHVKAARAQGATREEILETIAMAIYMGGGPSMVYGAMTLEAFDQFEAAEAQ